MILKNYHGHKMNNKGNLYLIPSDLGNDNLKRILPAWNFEIINNINIFIVENIRSARRFLRKAGYDHNFDKTTFHILNKQTEAEQYSNFLSRTDSGKDTGLISEAGLPCIADPGAEIVKIAHQKKINVTPLVGPSSLMLALMASGFNGQSFTFHGYLPIKKQDREKQLRQIEKQGLQKKQTQIFIETPYRNMQLFDSIIKSCQKKTQLCIACNITHPDGFIQTKSVEDWKNTKPEIHKKPCVFLIYS